MQVPCLAWSPPAGSCTGLCTPAEWGLQLLVPSQKQPLQCVPIFCFDMKELLDQTRRMIARNAAKALLIGWVSKWHDVKVLSSDIARIFYLASAESKRQCTFSSAGFCKGLKAHSPRHQLEDSQAHSGWNQVCTSQGSFISA